MKKVDNNFWKFYDAWKKETMFRAVIDFDNPNYKSLLDPYLVSIDELVDGVMEVLSEKDDSVVFALEKRLEMLLGQPIVSYSGYVSLEDCCKTWKPILILLKETIEGAKLKNK